MSLVNEDEDGDTAVLISDGEMKERAEENCSEEELTSLSPNVTVRQWRWKFWKKQRRYVVSHSPGRGRELSVCGRKIKLCGINSWRAIFLVLFVFSVAIAISVIVSKLAAEPPAIAAATPTTETATKRQGN